MAKSALFTKLKGFGPLIVIGTAVVVTIKLLTTTTPTVEEDLSVDAKEDISLTQYEDTIELPPLPPPAEEPKADEEKEDKEEEKEKADDEEEAPETEEDGDENAEKEQSEPQETEEQQKEENQPKKLKWKQNDTLSGLLSKLLGGGQKG